MESIRFSSLMTKEFALSYAYTKDGDYIRALNFNCLNNVAVICKDVIIETNMDDIEIQIVLDYLYNNIIKN